MPELIILDLETTGLDAKKDSIIEIAAVLLKDGKIVDKFQTLVQPAKNQVISSTVSVLTGIQASDLSSAPTLEEVREKLVNFIQDRPIVGHNIGFDLDFLKENEFSFAKVGLDTLELAHTILPKLDFYSLDYLSHYYQFDNQPSHRAMPDVLATTELLDLLISHIDGVDANLKPQITALINKSDWEWAFIFQNSSKPQKQYNHIKPEPEKPFEPSGNLGLISPEKIISGFNLFELASPIQQIPANIYLAQKSSSSLLVVSNDVFRQYNWEDLGFQRYYSSQVSLDKDKLKFLLEKPELSTAELKLSIKILLYGLKDEQFNPHNIYLTRDEFYLFDQKLSLNSSAINLSGEHIVTSFAGLYELLENEPSNLLDYQIFIPQWIKFDDFSLQQQSKIITSAYLNAVVSSRRDFVHDYVTDNKTKDQLFKQLNQLGTQLVMLVALLGLVGKEQQKNPFDVIEFEEHFLSTSNGAKLKDNLRGAIQVLSDYLKTIKEADNKAPADILNRQIDHTEELINYLNVLLTPSQAYKVYLEASDYNIMLNIVLSEPKNIWQDKLKRYKAIIASNGLLVSKESSFVSTILGENLTVQPIQGSNSVKKDMIWVRDLPNSNSANYIKQIKTYLKNWLDKEPGKSLIAMPNARLVGEFFDEYNPMVNSVELLSRDVAGNPKVLRSKLVDKDKYSLVVSSFQINRLLSAVDVVDRLCFIKVPFEPPNKLSQLLYSSKLDNTFIGYALPKAIVLFKENLSDIYHKTKEVWMLDSKLLIQDYGQIIRGSINGYTEIQE